MTTTSATTGVPLALTNTVWSPGAAPNPQRAQPTTGFALPSGQDPQVAQLERVLVTLLEALQAQRAKQAQGGGTTSAATSAAASGAASLSNSGQVTVTGGTSADAKNVKAALSKLGTLQHGAPIAQKLNAAGVHFVVEDDSKFEADGYGGMHAYFNETDGEIHIRKSTVEDTDSTQLVYEIAHEGTHLLDAASPEKQAFLKSGQAAVAQLGGTSTAAGAAAEKQLQLADGLITENNAYFYGGQVMKDLGVTRSQLKANGPGWQALGSGDETTVRKAIWSAILKDPVYNPDGLDPGYQTYT